MNLPILPKLIPVSAPKYIRITALVMFIFFEIIGLGISLQALWVSFGSFLLHMFYFLVLGAGASLIVLYVWDFFTRIARKKTYVILETYYGQNGYCMEMADALKSIMPAPTKRDRVLRVFLLVMSEHYGEAEAEIAKINEPSLLMREFAMLQTAKLRLYLMTCNKMEKAERIFRNYSEKIEQAYEMQPDFFPEYRSYADDAYEYFSFAAIYALLTHRPEAAAEYRRRAVFQTSNRCASEMECYTKLLELNELYASGKMQAAHDLEQQLYVLPETGSPPMTQGQKNDFRRAAEQAKIFSAHSRLAEDSLLTERRLPKSVDSPEISGLSLF